MIGIVFIFSGDGKVGKDACLRGGIATFHGVSCVVIATFKGHTPTDMQAANYGEIDKYSQPELFSLKWL